MYKNDKIYINSKKVCEQISIGEKDKKLIMEVVVCLKLLEEKSVD